MHDDAIVNTLLWRGQLEGAVRHLLCRIEGPVSTVMLTRSINLLVCQHQGHKSGTRLPFAVVSERDMVRQSEIKSVPVSLSMHTSILQIHSIWIVANTVVAI